MVVGRRRQRCFTGRPLDRHVLPVIGGLRLAELTTARVDTFLHGVLRDKGHATAKVCRSVVSGVCGLAVRRGALRSNPVRDVGDLERGDRAGARALTLQECRDWLAILDADPYAVRKDCLLYTSPSPRDRS